MKRCLSLISVVVFALSMSFAEAQKNAPKKEVDYQQRAIEVLKRHGWDLGQAAVITLLTFGAVKGKDAGLLSRLQTSSVFRALTVANIARAVYFAAVDSNK